MIPILRGLDLVVPRHLGDALKILAREPAARPFAGGTDLMVLLDAGKLPRAPYVSLWNLHELRGIADVNGGVSIGALTTFTDIRRSARLAAMYPMLGHAASQTGGIATQNRGTIGGNIANASPAADTPPALLAYDAELDLLSARGTRRVRYADFHLGYKKMRLEPGEIIARVFLPARTGWRDEYRKVGTRRAQAISKVCFAGSVKVIGDTVEDIRIALGSVAPTAVRCAAAERVVRGRAIDETAIAEAVAAVRQDVAPIDDLRSTAEYRRRVAQNLVVAFLRNQK